MKAALNPIILKPTESFTCVNWKVDGLKELSPTGVAFQLEYLLVALVESRGTVQIGDHLGPFRDGDIFLVAPKLPLYWRRYPEETRPIRTLITASFDEHFADHAFETPEAHQIRRMLARSRRGILFPRDISAHIIPDLVRVSQLKGWPRMALFLDVLGRLAAARKIRPLASPGFSSEINEKDLRRFSVVCKYVHASYADQIREKDVAALIGLSPAPFSRFFKAHMSIKFVNYVTEVRLNEACRRLEDTDLTIIQIAFETGFNNLSNFNRHFQKLRGMTPREYRSRHSELLLTKKKSAPAASRRKQ